MKLKTHVIRSLTPDKKTKRHYDGGGLYLEVRTTGNKFWRWKYRFEGKEKLLSFGQYPAVSIKEARLCRDRAVLTLAEGTDPGVTPKNTPAPPTFREVAEDWLANKLNGSQTIAALL